MRNALLMLGLPDMSMDYLWVIVAIAVVAAAAIGWIADLILGDGAFGVMLNTLWLLVGAIIGLLLWRKFGFAVRMNVQAMKALVATGSGVMMLLVCGVLRRWI